ncbi:MAG: GatB/YqeY domain-containing protein [Candidatus Saccharimonadales bacterium]
MQLKARIDQDLKAAMLAGDKLKTTTLRGLKSAILYAELAEGVKQKGFDESQVTSVINRESKKRRESAELYLQVGETERANQELAEKQFLDAYLPTQLSEDQINNLVDAAIAEIGNDDQKSIGQIIGLVKQKAAGSADGAVIAQLVKAKLNQ